MKEEKNINSGRDKDEAPTHSNRDSNNQTDRDMSNQEETKVENANAAGIGAMGRSDEKLTAYSSDDQGDADDY